MEEGELMTLPANYSFLPVHDHNMDSEVSYHHTQGNCGGNISAACIDECTTVNAHTTHRHTHTHTHTHTPDGGASVCMCGRLMRAGSRIL